MVSSILCKNGKKFAGKNDIGHRSATKTSRRLSYSLHFGIIIAIVLLMDSVLGFIIPSIKYQLIKYQEIMPQFVLAMSARSNGQTVYNSYNFDLGKEVSEEFLVQSYKEFYPTHSEVRVVSFTKVESEELVAI